MKKILGLLSILSLVGCGGEGGGSSPAQPDSGNKVPIERHVDYSDQAESLQGSLDRSNNQVWARTAGNPPVTKSFDILSNVQVSNVTFDVHMLVKHYSFMDFNVQCPSGPNVDIRFKTSGEYWNLSSQTEQFELSGGVNKTVSTWAEVQSEVGQCTFVEHSKTMSYGQIATGYALTTSNLLIEPYSNSYADGNGDDYQVWGGITICSTGMVGKNNECLIDTDGDGVPDVDDVFPNNPNEWLDTDGDGIGNNEDTDDDNDGVPDTEDAFPLDPSRSEVIDGTPIVPAECTDGFILVDGECKLEMTPISPAQCAEGYILVDGECKSHINEVTYLFVSTYASGIHYKNIASVGFDNPNYEILKGKPGSTVIGGFYDQITWVLPDTEKQVCLNIDNGDLDIGCTGRNLIKYDSVFEPERFIFNTGIDTNECYFVGFRKNDAVSLTIRSACGNQIELNVGDFEAGAYTLYTSPNIDMSNAFEYRVELPVTRHDDNLSVSIRSAMSIREFPICSSSCGIVNPKLDATIEGGLSSFPPFYPIEPAQCAEGYILVDGECQLKATPIEPAQCAEGYILVDGECQLKATPIEPAQCAEGYILVDGECQLEATPIEPAQCAEGYILVDGECQLKATPIEPAQCAEGYILVDGECLLEVTPIEPAQCADGFILIDGECECSAPKILVESQCLIDSDGDGIPDITDEYPLDDNLHDVVNIIPNSRAFAALRFDGSVVAWGNPGYGADISHVKDKLSALDAPKVVQIASTRSGFAALREDGAVISWGGNATYQYNEQKVVKLFSTSNNYIGITNEGKIAAITFSLDQELENILNDTNAPKAVNIYATDYNFAVLRDDGSVVVIPLSYSYGSDISAVKRYLKGRNDFQGGGGIIDIKTTYESFSALRADGSIVTWGTKTEGLLNPYSSNTDFSPVVKVVQGHFNYIAILESGNILSWGTLDYPVPDEITQGINAGEFKVVDASVGYGAFAILSNHGSVQTWGAESEGGSIDLVENKLRSDVKMIISNNSAFMALKNDGSIVTWGSYLYGGDSSAASPYLNGVSSIEKYSKIGFSAINSNGDLVSWTNYQFLPNLVFKDVPKFERIISNTSLDKGYSASAAIAMDGSVFAWGDPLGGGSIYENICELDGRYNSCLN